MAKVRLRLLRISLLIALAACSAWAAAIPAILIIRLKPPKGVPAYDSAIADYLGNEMQAGNRLIPIVWGIGDPIYRQAVESGKIRAGDQTPSIQEAFSVAKNLRAQYILAVDVRQGDGKILGAAYLYKDGRQIWKDPTIDLKPAIGNLQVLLRNKQITKEEYDQRVLEAGFRSSDVQIGSQHGADDTIRSMAHTWAEMLNNGPLSSLPKESDNPTPTPGKGQLPSSPETAGPLANDTQWQGDAEKALKSGDTAKAVNLVRDAIDVAPLDNARRIYLVKMLMDTGSPEVAAEAARRAAKLMPDDLELRSLAAKAWIQAGNIDEAQADLNEAIARAPNRPETLQLLAEIAIDKGAFPTAIDRLNQAIAVKSSGESYYLRALAYAMSGDTELSQKDLKSATDAGLSLVGQESEERYGLVASILDDQLVSIGGEIRSLHTRAQVQRSDPSVAKDYADLAKRVAGRSAFIGGLPVPSDHSGSHTRRVLAYKLLSQCLAELDSYLKTGNEDTLTDSRIDLGEALRQDASARLDYRNEQQGAKKSNGQSG